MRRDAVTGSDRGLYGVKMFAINTGLAALHLLMSGTDTTRIKLITIYLNIRRCMLCVQFVGITLSCWVVGPSLRQNCLNYSGIAQQSVKICNNRAMATCIWMAQVTCLYTSLLTN